MRVAHIDMRNTSVNCPAPLTQYQLDSGERVCGSTNSATQSCDSVIFPTHHLSYQHVCGRAAGFSYFHPCAFYFYKHHGQNIDHAYVVGLSITYGPQNGRNHIWTYAGGYQESEPVSCTPTPPSRTERTATLGAVAATMLLLRGSGHSRRRPQRS